MLNKYGFNAIEQVCNVLGLNTENSLKPLGSIALIENIMIM